MAVTVSTLSPVSVVAERAMFGQPDFTVLQTATATALNATYTPARTNDIARLFKLSITYSAAPAVGVFQVTDGTTVIWQGDISASPPFGAQVDFSAKPLRASPGAALGVTVGSAGGAVVQTICWTGDVLHSSTG